MVSNYQFTTKFYNTRNSKSTTTHPLEKLGPSYMNRWLVCGRDVSWCCSMSRRKGLLFIDNSEDWDHCNPKVLEQGKSKFHSTFSISSLLRYISPLEFFILRAHVTPTEIEEMVNELSLDDFQVKIGGGAVLPLLPESDIPALLSALPESDFPSSPWPRRYSSSLIGSSELDPILIDSDPSVTAALPEIRSPQANSSGATPVVSSTEEAQDLTRKGAANSGDYGKRRRKNVNQNLKAKQEALPGCNSKCHKVGILDCATECVKSTVQESEKMATQQNIMSHLGINPQPMVRPHPSVVPHHGSTPSLAYIIPRMVQYLQQVSVYNVPYMPQVYNHMNGHMLNSHHVMCSNRCHRQSSFSPRRSNRCHRQSSFLSNNQNRDKKLHVTMKYYQYLLFLYIF